MIAKVKYIFLLFIASTALGFGQNNVTLFETANKLYNEAKYQEAITQYKAILDTGNHSAELYYNLGNSYYKLNQIGSSIYYYEKALQLTPNDQDIKNNLAFANNMTIDAIEELPKTQVAKFMGKITGTFTYDQWAWLAVFFAFLCMISFLLYQFSYQTTKKRIYFIISFIALLFILGTVTIAFEQFYKAGQDNPAIIFAKETTVKSEPNVRSDEVFVLHEGTKVQVLEQVNDWKKIRLIDGKIGWIIAEDAKEL